MARICEEKWTPRERVFKDGSLESSIRVLTINTEKYEKASEENGRH